MTIFGTFGGPQNAQQPLPYSLNEETLKKDLTSERPQWILSAYGPGRNPPIQLFGGLERELSPEEMRVRHYLAVAAGNPQQAINEAQQLYNQAETQIQMAANNLQGALQYVIAGKDQHPNRFDICGAAGGTPTPTAQSVPSAFNSQPNSAFGQPSASAQQPNSTFGQTSTPAQQPSSTFGQPSRPGFGQTGFGTAKPAQPAFGATGFGGLGQNSAFGQTASLGPTGGSAFGQTSGLGTGLSGFGKVGFGQASSLGQSGGSAFGQTSSPGIGTGISAGIGAGAALGAAPTTGFSAFANKTPSFGQTGFGQASGFGGNQQPASGGFGTGSGFGQQTPSAFTGPSSANKSAPAFGGNSFAQQQPIPSTAPISGFGVQSQSPFSQAQTSANAGAPIQLSTNPFSAANTLSTPAAPSFTAVREFDAQNRIVRFKGCPVQWEKASTASGKQTKTSSGADEIAYYVNVKGEKVGIWLRDIRDGRSDSHDQDSELPKDNYDDGTEMAYEHFKEHGSFMGDKMPAVPPLHEWTNWNM
ncbi:MAG: hypothetical protein M1834_001471 [Cirrosporium novae-zelandiae]|nr:MAG: hypothetical protein M1834_008623 [Cirrosporium novae-zelandiae]KAI9736005.1 MAG: hypothetical protein M1834_001471 [Cirrosporium novae-zelandiae]